MKRIIRQDGPKATDKSYVAFLVMWRPVHNCLRMKRESNVGAT